MSVRSPGYGPRIAIKWGDVADKPATFSPAAHTHSYASLTDIPTTFAPAPHTHDWASITGKPATFAPAAHTHAGLLSLVGNVTVTEQTLLSLALGMKRMTLPLTGIVTADMGKLVVVPNGTSTAGCEVQNAYPVAANSVSIGYFTPALSIGATYSIPVSVYRIA